MCPLGLGYGCTPAMGTWFFRTNSCLSVCFFISIRYKLFGGGTHTWKGGGHPMTLTYP